MLKMPPMVVGLGRASPELNLGNRVRLLGDDLPAVVFSDEPIIKTHDSVPTGLFRFAVLVKLHEARELSWVAYFYPWILLNEGMSHKGVETSDRVR
jgi:hypothetical protein